MGRAKWGWYISLFKRVSGPDGHNYAMSPVEYLEAHERAPRFMAILDVIQSRFIWNAAKQMDEHEKEARRGQLNRHAGNSRPTERPGLGRS